MRFYCQRRPEGSSHLNNASLIDERRSGVGVHTQRVQEMRGDQLVDLRHSKHDGSFRCADRTWCGCDPTTAGQLGL